MVTFFSARTPGSVVLGKLCAAIFACRLEAAVLVTAARADIRITHDEGGLQDVYRQRVNAARASGERVLIDGFCSSSCTLYLTLPRVCATARAELLFHAPFDVRTGLPTPAEAERLLAIYPPGIRSWIIRHGGLSHIPIKLRGAELAQLLPRCR